MCLPYNRKFKNGEYMNFTAYQNKVIAYCTKLRNSGLIGTCEYQYQMNAIVNADSSNTLECIENELHNAEFV